MLDRKTREFCEGVFSDPIRIPRHIDIPDRNMNIQPHPSVSEDMVVVIDPALKEQSKTKVLVLDSNSEAMCKLSKAILERNMDVEVVDGRDIPAVDPYAFVPPEPKPFMYRPAHAPYSEDEIRERRARRSSLGPMATIMAAACGVGFGGYPMPRELRKVFGSSQKQGTICGIAECNKVNPDGKDYCCAEHCKLARERRKNKS